VRVSWVLVFFALCVIPRLVRETKAVGEESPYVSPFSSAPQSLSTRVSYVGSQRRLDQLLRELSDQARVTLTATGRHAPRRLTVAVRDVPLRELLDAIARSLDLTWVKRNDGYILARRIRETDPEYSRVLVRALERQQAVEREKISFLSNVFASSQLNDEQVKKTAEEYPLRIKQVTERHAFARVAIRAITWLSLDQRAEVFVNPKGITLDRDFLLQTGDDLRTGVGSISLLFNEQGDFLIRAFTELTPVNGLPRRKYEELRF